MDSSRATLFFLERLLIGLVATFAADLVLVALLLGFVLSWSFVLPLRRISATLAHIAAGHFGEQVERPERDEFSSLATNLNVTSQTPGERCTPSWTR